MHAQRQAQPGARNLIPLLLGVFFVAQVALAQTPPANPAGGATGIPGLPAALPSGTVVRRVVMKDAQSAEQFKLKLETMKATNLFRDTIPGPDPKKPVVIEISFLSSGNYLLVIGSREWVDAHLESIRLMAYLFERPRAHLQLNLRVVQLTGPANADVIQMTETIRALVDSQREEVVRTFADLDDYLTARAQSRKGADGAVLTAARRLLPTLGTGERPLTVPEILILLMLDRSSPAALAAPGIGGAEDSSPEVEEAFMALPRELGILINDPRKDPAAAMAAVAEELTAWKQAVSRARDWCATFGEEFKKSKSGAGVPAFREALQGRGAALPFWIARRLNRSLELTERLYPSLLRKHCEGSLKALEGRYTAALEREARIEDAIGKREKAPMPEKPADGRRGPARPAPVDATAHNMIALKTLAEELIPTPMALFDSVAMTNDNSAPDPGQVLTMLQQYADERTKVDERLSMDVQPARTDVNYSRLQSLEAGLNLWLRRVSEAMARALDAQVYRRYVNEVRLLANKQLGRGSNRDLLNEISLDQIPDVSRDVLLSDTGVNIFVSNSISLQFSPDTTNSVTAQVQSSLPQKTSIIERLQQANQAQGLVNSLAQTYGISGEDIVKSLLGGGQAVPVQGGISLSATPSVGFDAGTVSLSLTANQTLAPGTDKVADRVTNHTINNATVTAISYEPMVLSTLASNISYYETTGGIPILRKIPIVGKLTKDVPLPGFKESKRQKGVFQSSVIILEPVVIPTIEDLVRYHAGWREMLQSQPTAAPAAPAKP